MSTPASILPSTSVIEAPAATAPGIALRMTADLQRDLALAALNDTHAVVTRAGTTMVANFGYDPGLGRKIITWSTFQDIRNRYSHEYVPGVKYDPTTRIPTPTHTPKGQAWLNWRQRRQYDGVSFAPGRKLGSNQLNLWQGFAVTPAQGVWAKYQALIRDVICSGNDEHYTYMLNWMARAVQMPGQPGEVAVVLRGGRGTGKSTFCGLFGDLFGPHYLQITSAQHLTGQFNAHLETCALLFLDEAMWAGDHAGEGVLKGLITERTIAVRAMRTNMYHAPNCLHVMMATNSEWAVPAGAMERRFFVLDVANLYQQDTEYFGGIHREMQSGGLAAMLYDLQRRDITCFNVRNVPHTEALDEQQVRGHNPTEAWWYDVLVQGTFDEEAGGWPTHISRTAIHQHYIRATGLSGVKRRSTQTMLGWALRRLVPELRKQRGMYALPPLTVCRETWDRLMRTKTEWETED